MLILYYPPYRAEDDVELLDQAVVSLRAYVEDLAEFDDDALARGWRDVRRAHKVERWPTIEAIRTACMETKPLRARRAAAPNTEAKPWEARAERISRMRADAVTQWMRGPLGQRLAEEGLARFLQGHVQRIAHVQAQEIAAGRRDALDITIPDELVATWRECRDSQARFKHDLGM